MIRGALYSHGRNASLEFMQHFSVNNQPVHFVYDLHSTDTKNKKSHAGVREAIFGSHYHFDSELFSIIRMNKHEDFRSMNLRCLWLPSLPETWHALVNLTAFITTRPVHAKLSLYLCFVRLLAHRVGLS